MTYKVSPALGVEVSMNSRVCYFSSFSMRGVFSEVLNAVCGKLLIKTEDNYATFRSF